MTCTPVKPKTIVIGITEQGYRTGSSHHNYNGRITQTVVDALRDLNEEGLGYGCLSLMFGISRGYVAAICRYEKRVSYATRFKTIKVGSANSKA